MRAIVSGETVRLASQSGIRDCAALRQELVSLLDVQTAVTIDASAAERVDTTTLQLLHAFERDRAARGLTVAWGERHPAFARAATLLGLRLGATEA